MVVACEAIHVQYILFIILNRLYSSWGHLARNAVSHWFRGMRRKGFHFAYEEDTEFIEGNEFCKRRIWSVLSCVSFCPPWFGRIHCAPEKWHIVLIFILYSICKTSRNATCRKHICKSSPTITTPRIFNRSLKNTFPYIPMLYSPLCLRHRHGHPRSLPSAFPLSSFHNSYLINLKESTYSNVAHTCNTFESSILTVKRNVHMELRQLRVWSIEFWFRLHPTPCFGPMFTFIICLDLCLDHRLTYCYQWSVFF